MNWQDYVAMGLMVVLVLGTMVAIRRLVTRGGRDDDDQ